MKKILQLFILLSVQTAVAQSVTLLPNSVSSNAITTTANRLGVNISNPNYELHVNRNGNVNTFAQFTNNFTGQDASGGLLVGVNSLGEAIFNQQGDSPVRFFQNNLERFKILNGSSLNSSVMTLKNSGLDIYSKLSSEHNLISEAQNEFKMYADYDVSNTNYLSFNIYRTIEGGTIAGIPRANLATIVASTGIDNLYFNNVGNQSFYFGGPSDYTLRIEPGGRKVGIATTNVPTRTLDVNGNARIGVNGNTITAINNATISADLPLIAAGSSYSQTFSLLGIIHGNNTVYVSPSTNLTDGIVIAFARVISDYTIEVKFTNVSASSIDLPSTSFHFTVVTFP